ncbi:Lrp/AsnC family transcriptional regulator [Phyllobacterium sophorae]|uniref:ArsR family transcriptional regulator n=1 Tax=Phyllobacterium sophorae TaxID=1520277 RepID=A0A2P7AN26_9HYPH|nr:Lrp/AsnC family transcriptional regulator [Phyllobacterium sophorae]PSH55591.1 ArsR family transcriptional regulator [Phyllobacterium sophorae]
MDLDRIDLKILSAVQCNNRLTTEQLGQLAGLSPTACQRRLKHLRDSGVIQADVAVVSPEAVGRPLMMLVLVDIERYRSDVIDRFKQTIQRAPEVMSAYAVTGNADFVLIISVRDLAEYDAFSQRFFFDSPVVRNYSTMIVMDRTKVSLAIPIDV